MQTRFDKDMDKTKQKLTKCRQLVVKEREFSEQRRLELETEISVRGQRIYTLEAMADALAGGGLPGPAPELMADDASSGGDLTGPAPELMADDDASSGGDLRLERSEKRDKVQRVSRLKMGEKTIFARLISACWRNDDSNVNRFIKLDNADNTLIWEPITLMPKLTVRFSAGTENDYVPSSDFKHRAFGFCFRGSAISENALRKSDLIKEAYGVEVEGVHYVCVVFFKRSGGFQLSTASTLPYAYGLLPCTIMVDLIPGRDYHLAVYMVATSTDDPVLDMLKRPSADKWHWHA